MAAGEALVCQAAAGRRSRAGHSEAVATSGSIRGLRDAVARLEAEPYSGITSGCYTSLLRACAELRSLNQGRRIHALVSRCNMEQDPAVRSSLVRMYLRCSRLADARALFFAGGNWDVVLWTELISGHVRVGDLEAALEIHGRMNAAGVEPNRVTFLVLLGACRSYDEVAGLHHRITAAGLMDTLLGNALINVYARLGRMDLAVAVFEELQEADLVSWTTMVMAYGQEGEEQQALRLFRRMLLEGFKPDSVAFLAVLSARGASISECRWIHSCAEQAGLDTHPLVATSLVDMYGKSGRLDGARAVFSQGRAVGDSIFWTAMLAVYAQAAQAWDALLLFKQMQLEGLKPNQMTFSTIISACPVLAEGIRIHGLAVESGLHRDAVVQNSLVNMYARCGDLKQARHIFDQMTCRGTNSWNSMVTAYAQHGRCHETQEIFMLMEQAGHKPDDVTLVAVLSACARAGLVEEACRLFVTMDDYFGIRPSVAHYGCLVDLLARSGWLLEAEAVINHRMPSQPDATIWTALCSGSRNHGDADAGKAAGKVLELEPDNTGLSDLLTADYYR